jgi:hypothetical protein
MHQFLSVIISLCCCYVFRKECAILRELDCTFSVTCQFGFLVDNIVCILCDVRIDLSIDTHLGVRVCIDFFLILIGLISGLNTVS